MAKRRKKKRKIKLLKSATLLDLRPEKIPEPKPNKRSWAAAGLRYEKQVADYLRAKYGEEHVLHGPWIDYEDAGGKGLCSPDVIVLPDDRDFVVVVECKLTVSKAALTELRTLYVPLAESIWPATKVRAVQATHNLKLKWSEPTTFRWSKIFDPKAKWKYITLNWR
jgi:hypothetical protein